MEETVYSTSTDFDQSYILDETNRGTRISEKWPQVYAGSMKRDMWKKLDKSPPQNLNPLNQSLELTWSHHENQCSPQTYL